MILASFYTLLKTGTNAHLTGAQVFWNNVSVNGTNCWTWLGNYFSNGYGKFNLRGRCYIASRVAYQLYHNKELANDIVVCHTCDNTWCCNPNHHFEGTQKDNIHDAIIKNRLKINYHLGSTRRIISDSDIQTIRDMYKTGKYLQKDIATLYNVRPNHISRIVNYKRR